MLTSVQAGAAIGLWAPAGDHALGNAFAAEPFGLIFALTSAVIGALALTRGCRVPSRRFDTLGRRTACRDGFVDALVERQTVRQAGDP